MVELSREVFESLRVSKKFRENTGGPTNCLDFDDTGEFLVTSCEADGSILVYNCTEGE